MCAQGRMVKVLFALTLLTPGCTTLLAGALATGSSGSSSKSKTVKLESLDDAQVKAICVDAKHKQSRGACFEHLGRRSKVVIEGGSCDELPKSTELIRSEVEIAPDKGDWGGMRGFVDRSAAKKAVMCKDAGFLFGVVLPRNKDPRVAQAPTEHLKYATDSGKDEPQALNLDEMFISYIEGAPQEPFGEDEHHYLVARAYRLYRTRDAKSLRFPCDRVSAALIKSSVKQMPAAELLNVLQTFECAEGVPLAERGLMDKVVDTRYNACLLLRDHGSAKHAKNLEILAKTDPHTATVRGNIVYPVRDICAQALGQVMMRAN